MKQVVKDNKMQRFDMSKPEFLESHLNAIEGRYLSSLLELPNANRGIVDDDDDGIHLKVVNE